jgi:membrane protein YqaA with SNARE-associated domain
VRERGWQWFVGHAQSRFSLVWLALLGVADTIFFPISVEAFLAVLVLAHPAHWRRYITVALTSSVTGAIIGYWLLFYIFQTFGEQYLATWGIEGGYAAAQALIGGQIFFTMLLATFTPLPDKLFIYAAGILAAPFWPFVFGFVLGRGARMALVTFLVLKLGPMVLESFNKYSFFAAIGATLLMTLYILHKIGLFF